MAQLGKTLKTISESIGPKKVEHGLKHVTSLLDWVEFGQSCRIKKPVKPLLPFGIRFRKMPLV